MAEIKSAKPESGEEIDSPTQNRIERGAPPVKKGGVRNERAQSSKSSQSETVKPLTSIGGISAADRLLGLDLRPPVTGALPPPPGNSEFLRHVSPPMRRTIMRKMLDKQRERMRKLARFLRDRRDETDQGHQPEQERESFLEVIAEKNQSEEYNADKNQIFRAAGELDKTARMLDILDEMLAMQDYTISRIGTFTQG